MKLENINKAIYLIETLESRKKSLWDAKRVWVAECSDPDPDYDAISASEQMIESCESLVKEIELKIQEL